MLHVMTSITIDWDDLFLLHLLSYSFKWEVRIKYAEDFRYPGFNQMNFPNAQTSIIKPLAKEPTFGSRHWNFETGTPNGQTPAYYISDDFYLIYGGDLLTRPYLHQIEQDSKYYMLTALPRLPFEKQHIVTRHPLAHAASFDPLLPLDILSWILSAGSFLVLITLIIISHLILRPTQSFAMNKLYYASYFWKNLTWFKTSSLLLFLWGTTFFMVNNAYQIDFRMSLISQTLEKPVDSWNDVDLFDISIHTFTLPELSPVSKKSFFSHKNLLEYDRYYYRYVGRCIGNPILLHGMMHFCF